MPPRLGLYSLADTPEELLNRGYGYTGDIPYRELSDEEQNLMRTTYDPAFGNLNTQMGYFSAPYTGNIPFQNVSFLKDDGPFGFGYDGDIDLPSFGGSGNPRFNQFGKDIDFINAPQDIYPEAVPPDFINAPQNFYPPNLTSTKGLPTLNLQSLPANMGVANEDDERQVDSLTGQKKSTGIMDLIMSVAIPGYGFLKNIGRGSLEGIRGLNQRLRNTDFAKSSSLADYFDARSYGGRDARDRAASQNMREARAIQRQVDMRPSANQTNQDRGRGNRPGGANYSAPSRPSRSSGFSSSARGRALHG